MDTASRKRNSAVTLNQYAERREGGLFILEGQTARSVRAQMHGAFAIKVMLPEASGAFRGGGPRIYNGNTDKLIYARETFSLRSNCEIFRYTQANVVDGPLFFKFYWFRDIFY